LRPAGPLLSAVFSEPQLVRSNPSLPHTAVTPTLPDSSTGQVSSSSSSSSCQESVVRPLGACVLTCLSPASSECVVPTHRISPHAARAAGVHPSEESPPQQQLSTTSGCHVPLSRCQPTNSVSNAPTHPIHPHPQHPPPPSPPPHLTRCPMWRCPYPAWTLPQQTPWHSASAWQQGSPALTHGEASASAAHSCQVCLSVCLSVCGSAKGAGACEMCPCPVLARPCISASSHVLLLQ
jgi:hypothetical protein